MPEQDEIPDVVPAGEAEQGQTQEPATEPVQDKAANAESGVKPEDIEAEAEPEPTVPVKRMNQLYGRTVRAEQQAAYWQGVAEGRIKVPNAQPAREEPTDPKLRDAAKFIRDSVAPELDPIKQEFSALREERLLNKAERDLTFLWKNHPDIDDDTRAQVEEIYTNAVVRAGDPSKATPAKLVLAAVIGERQLEGQQTVKRKASSTAAAVARANQTARTETGHRAAPPASRSTKKFSEKSAKEIEDEYGDVVIWKRRGGAEDDDE